MLEKIYITEEASFNPAKWFISFEKPEFQGGESIEIDKTTAQELLRLKTNQQSLEDNLDATRLKKWPLTMAMGDRIPFAEGYNQAVADQDNLIKKILK